MMPDVTWFDVMFGAGYAAIGFIVALLTRNVIDGGLTSDHNKVAWYLERILYWPFYALAYLLGLVQEGRHRVGDRIGRRPPKWYDFLFFWVL